MSLIKVPGTPLQAAIDKAQPGDTIEAAAGGYAGVLTVTKPLTLELGAAVINGPEKDGFINLLVQSKNVTVRDGDFRHAGAAIKFKGDCTGSLAQRTLISVVDWMVQNGSQPNTGGMGFALDKAVGVTIEDAIVARCRAKSTAYGVDGSAYEFFAARDIIVRRTETRDNVNVTEWGKNAADPLNTNVVFEDSWFHGRPNPSVAATYSGPAATYSAGLYIRAADALTVRNCLFDLLDAWCWVFDTKGGYAGALKNINATGNRARLMPGTNRWMADNPGSVVPLAEIHSDRNSLWPAAGTVLAEFAGKRYTDKAAMVAALGIEANSYVGPEPPPVPADPCIDLRTQLEQVTGERDDAREAAAAAGVAANEAFAARDAYLEVVRRVQTDVQGV